MDSTVQISFGEVVLCVRSDIPLELSENMSRFRVTDDVRADMTVSVKNMDSMIRLPDSPCGDDMLLNYYNDGKLCYAVAKPGTLGPVTVTAYTSDFSEATVYVNEKEHPGIVRTVDKVLQLFPIRQLLLNYNAMVLHSSEVIVSGKGILFTAPSGTGKSTQAMLWNKYENAEFVCNDRTLIRRLDGEHYTYGYPIDGSIPKCRNEKHELAAIIVLRQGSENSIERLSALKALKYLMEQTVLDTWNRQTISTINQEWIDILKQHPVYLFTCRPDREAVVCLKQQLKKDEVI